MVTCTNGTGIKLSGHWNISGVVLQIESLSTLHQLESGLEKLYNIDCSEISSVDISGLQLLHVWLQCVRLRGVKPELINLPEGMQQTIKQLGLENCFADFYVDSAQETSRDN
jgi:anti-anti-sigma regulatory factor